MSTRWGPSHGTVHESFTTWYRALHRTGLTAAHDVRMKSSSGLSVALALAAAGGTLMWSNAAFLLALLVCGLTAQGASGVRAAV